MPIQWRLAGSDSLPPELKVFPSSGRLEARKSIRVAVEFTALEKREVSHKVVLEVLDAAELLGVATSIPIPIKAEAYKMEVDVKFPQVGGRRRASQGAVMCCWLCPSHTQRASPVQGQMMSGTRVTGCMQPGLGGLLV